MTEGPDPQGELLRGAIRRYEEFGERQAYYRKLEIGVAVALLVIVVAFILASYGRMRSTYTMERIGPHLSREMTHLSPQINHAALEVAKDVLPTYIELTEKKLGESLPQIEDSVEREVEILWTNMHRQLRQDFDDALERSAKKLEARLRAEFPELLEPAALTILERELTEMLEEDTSDFIERFFDRYSRDLNSLYATLEGFRGNRFEKMSEEELTANYFHLWLTLLDYDIMGVK